MRHGQRIIEWGGREGHDLQRSMSPQRLGGRQESVRLAACNVPGFAANEGKIDRLLGSGAMEVLFLSETKLSNASRFVGVK